MSQEAAAQKIPDDIQKDAQTAETPTAELPVVEKINRRIAKINKEDSLEGVEEISNEILETDQNEKAAENAIKQANEEFRQTAKMINKGETAVHDYARQSSEDAPEESISGFKKLRDSGEKLFKGFLQLFKKKPELADINPETELEGLLESDLELALNSLDLTKNPEPNVVRGHIKAIDKKIADLKAQQTKIEKSAYADAGEELAQRNLKYEIIAYQKRREDLEDYLNFRIQTPESPAKEVKPALSDEEEPTLEDLGIAKKSIFRRPQKTPGPKTTKGKMDAEEVPAGPTIETEKVKVNTGYERLVEHEEAAINTDLEATRLEAEYAVKRREGIEILIKTKDINGLVGAVQKMQIIWTNLAEARSNSAHSRQERVLYKKALRGDAIIVDQPSTLDLIIRDINRAKQAVDSLRAGLEPAQVEEEALSKSVEDAWWEEKVGSLAGAPEILPTLEEKKAEVVKLEEEKTEVAQTEIKPAEEEPKEIYEAIIPEELKNLNKTALKKIEDRMRELDQLSGSFEMREKQRVTTRQIENEMRLLIDQQKELLRQNIPDEIVKAEIESLEKEIKNLPKELKKFPETLSEETERLKEQQKILADYLERGYDLELAEIEIETQETPGEPAKTEEVPAANIPEEAKEKDPALQIIERLRGETYNAYNRRRAEISKLLEFDDNAIIESGTTRKALETELDANEKMKAELETGEIPADLIKDKIRELTDQIEFVLDRTLPDEKLSPEEAEKMHATNKKQAEKLQAEKKVFVDYLKREKPQTTTSETVPIVGIEQAPSYQADKEEFINLKSELAFLEMDKSPSNETKKKKGELAKKIRKIDFWKRYRNIAERERTLVAEAIVDKAMELKNSPKKPTSPETAASSAA